MDVFLWVIAIAFLLYVTGKFLKEYREEIKDELKEEIKNEFK